MSTPKEMVYLELGLIPLREIIKQRRLNFLHYILTQDEATIIYIKFFKSRINKGTRKIGFPE